MAKFSNTFNEGSIGYLKARLIESIDLIDYPKNKADLRDIVSVLNTIEAKIKDELAEEKRMNGGKQK